MAHRLLANGCAISGKKPRLRLATSVTRRPGKADCPHRLVGRAAAWPGNTGNGQCPISKTMLERALRHRSRRRFGNCAVPSQGRLRNAEHVAFCGIRIRDEAAVEPRRTTRNRRQRLGNPAAGAGLRHSRRSTPLKEPVSQTFSQFFEFMHGMHRSMGMFRATRRNEHPVVAATLPPGATNSNCIFHGNSTKGRKRNNSFCNILLQKATKGRQTERGGDPRIQLCIEPLLSKLPLSRNLHPAAGGVFFAPLRRAVIIEVLYLTHWGLRHG